jgi:predicted esterase
MKISSILCCALLFTGLPVVAKDKNPPLVDAPAKVKPGSTGMLKAAGKGMGYFLRVPRNYDASKGSRLVVFLHGSNMNGMDYLRSFEAKKWCADAILCCPNGENGADPNGPRNFGFESGPLVADVTEEVQKAFKTTVTFIGGHSQGAFLTYNVILNFPELFHGAFPMAGDCWMQNEPNLWEDKPEATKKHRNIAIAVIHGKADPVVQFSQGEHGYDCFRAMGWTKLRLFAPDKLNHMFMLAPIEEAIEWLDAMNGLNEPKSMQHAAKWARAGEWGWVSHAAKGSKSGASALKAAETAATKATLEMTATLKEKPADWIPKWTEFVRIYGESEAAKPLLAKQQTERDQSRQKAVGLFNEAQQLFRAQKKPEGLKVLEQLRETAPATYQGYFAWKWLSEAK